MVVKPEEIAIAEELRTLPLEERVPELVRRLAAAGLHNGWARPAHYGVDPLGSVSATKASLERILEGKHGAFVAHTIGHPGGTNTVVKRIGNYGRNIILEGDALPEHFLDVITDDDEARPLPWPVVWNAGDTMVFEFSADSGLDTLTRITVRGFHVDAHLAEILKQRELSITTITRTTTAATRMKLDNAFVITKAQEVSHLLAKETISGDAVRVNVGLVFKGQQVLPSGEVLPPSTPAKTGCRFDATLDVDDKVTPELLYTSAGGAGFASLALTFIGCRNHG